MVSGGLITNGLTEREEAFVRYLARGTPKCLAAKLAGYACPDQEPARLLRRRDVAAALAATLRENLDFELAPIAQAQLRALLLNADTSDNAKVRAIDIALKSSGLNKPPGDMGPTASKSLAGFSKSDIEKLNDLLRKRVASYDTDVNTDPFGLDS